MKRPQIQLPFLTLQHLREYNLLVGVISIILVSLLTAWIWPPSDPRIEIDVQRAVSEQACIPWASKEFDVSRALFVGNSTTSTGTEPAEFAVGSQSVKIAGGAIANVGKQRLPVNFKVEGDAAAKISALTVAATGSGLGTGAAITGCGSAGQDWWFTGIDTTSGSNAMLWLSNPDSEAVTASITGYTKNGAVTTSLNQHVMVPAMGAEKLDLTLAFPAETAVAVHVHLSEGRVAANVQAWSLDGPMPKGRSYIAAIDRPAATSVIAGVSASASSSVLQLMSPDNDAAISVSIVTPDGSSRVAEADKFPIAANQVYQFELNDLLDSDSATILIESSQPVVAALRQFVQSSGGTDLNVQAAQSVVVGTSAVLLPDTARLRALTAYAATDSVVKVSAYANGELLWQTDGVKLSANTSLNIKPDQQAPAGGLLVVESSAPIYLTSWFGFLNGRLTSSLSNSTLAAELVPGTSLHLAVS